MQLQLLQSITRNIWTGGLLLGFLCLLLKRGSNLSAWAEIKASLGLKCQDIKASSFTTVV